MLRQLALCLSLAASFIGGESIRINSQFPFNQHDVHGEIGEEHTAPIREMGNAPPQLGKRIPHSERDTWIIDCGSELINHECVNVKHKSNTTFWQTKVDKTTIDSLPHNIYVDLREIKNVNAISVRPLPDADLGGAIAGHKVYLSKDNITWSMVAFGAWFEDVQDKFAVFEPKEAQYLRLEANSATNGTQFIRVVSIDVWATEAIASSSSELGQWGATVDFPIVPVGVFIDPITGRVISFSSYAHDSFGQGVTDHTTLTATWDPNTEEISHRHVRHTDHDMFCPGMAFDVDGRMIISGGESADRVSVYKPKEDNWTSLPQMKIDRGYQGSTILANGHIFVIGGSWGPQGLDFGDRFGETYDPVGKEWHLLNGLNSSHIETTSDWEGQYRADNHVWLTPWKNNSLFHTGPAKTMHWITPTGSGAIQEAGHRGEHDSMCGAAAMYDAVKGKILAAGGASSYNYLDKNGVPRGEKARKDAFVITLDQVNASVQIEPAGDGLHFARSFTHAVVLPNGETLIVGGQEEPRVFTERTPTLTPEIYSPSNRTWMKAAPNSVVRAYHSFALLLRDATVLVGGGGLSIQQDVNHFDAQIYIPQYLLNSDGSRAKRPKITSIPNTPILPGGNFSISTDTHIVDASLVRYGGATHSLNNDQRRIPVHLVNWGGPHHDYIIQIPKDGGVAIPGYYMLFVMDVHGVPSEARNVQILVAEEHKK